MCGTWEEGLSGSLLLFSPDNAIVHGCDVLNKRGFARPYVLLEHTLVVIQENTSYGLTNGSPLHGKATVYSGST